MSFVEDAHIIITELDKYIKESQSAQKPVIHQKSLQTLIDAFNLKYHIQHGGLSHQNLKTFVQKYLSATTRLHHPNYLAHQVAVPHYAGALGALIDSFTNNAMAVYEMGPGAASIEYGILNWMLEKIGWNPSPINQRSIGNQPFGGGILTHGGSLANLTAMIAARNRVSPDVWDSGMPGDLAILAPASCHYSIERAAGILGIGRNAIYRLDVDDQGAVLSDKLKISYGQLRHDGKRPMALIANACSTAVGIYDPISEIGDFCLENNIWFHVDGAHGASALLSERYKHFLKGIEKADSMTWDAHKLMRTPTLCAALLVKDHNNIDTAFEQEASYLFHDKEQPGFDFLHRTVECTKAGLGLKMFMALGALGEKGLADYIDHQYDLTLDIYEYIRQMPDFLCPVKPQSNILCFRIKGSDEMQIKIRDALTMNGEFYISTTLFNNIRYLRLAVMNPDTTLGNIKELIEHIKQLRHKI